MTDNWTIEAKVLPLGIGGHLYLEIWDSSGEGYTQINGFAADRTTGTPKTVGGPEESIRGFIGDHLIGKSGSWNQLSHGHEGTVLFEGNQSQLQSGLNTLMSNSQTFNNWVGQ